MRLIYFQPRLNAERNYRNGEGAEQVWCPWWALLLHQYAGRQYEAVLIDARCDAGWKETLGNVLGSDSVLAVSVMTGHAIRDAVEASTMAKLAGATVFWGGPHPTLFAEDVSSQPFVDHVVLGFGAQVFGRAVREIAGGQVLPTVVDSRGSRGPTPVTLLKSPTTSAAFAPEMGLVVSWDKYRNVDQAIGERSVNLITSEGCLRRCTYCSEPTTSGHSWLTYDVADCANVAAHVTQAAGADGLKLHDANFLHDTSRGIRFARLVAESVRLPWAATIHPDDLLNISESDLGELAACGLSRVLVGLESPVQSLVDLAGKRYDVKRIPELAEKLDRHGIAGMFAFIVGWPGAQDSHYQATIDAAFALRSISDRHQAKIHFLEPWPGTPLFKLMSRQNPLPMRTLMDWAEIDYYFAHLPQLHAPEWESAIRTANEELSPYVEA